MLEWIKRRGATAPDRVRVGARVMGQPGQVMPGKYLSLYQYVENRYANTVVLTFGEIEDLLGFALPDLARLRQEWWTESLTLATRIIKPNLIAQTVVFERGV